MTHALLTRLVPGITLAALTLATHPARAVPVKIAGVGSSSMAGVGSSPGRHIPDELGKALGPDFTVRNFGVAATTAIKAVANAYTSTPQMRDALAFAPDVVLFWFGGNDSWVETWNAHKGEFKTNYTDLVRTFQSLPSRPKTFLIRLWVFREGPAQKVVLDREILPMIDQIAAETNSTVIDYRTFIEPHPEWFPDGMHANDTGTAFIGKFFAEQVTQALKARADAGAADAGNTVDSSGGDARGDGVSTIDGSVVESGRSPASGDSGGAGAGGGIAGGGGEGGGTGADGKGATNAGGAGGAAGATTAPPGAGGSQAVMTGAGKGSCSFGGTGDGGFVFVLLSALTLLMLRRKSREIAPHPSWSMAMIRTSP